MVQCSPLREATLSAYRATARFGAYHRAAYGGYYATKRYAQRASYLSPERLRPFRSGSMFSQASKGFGERREVILPRRPPAFRDKVTGRRKHEMRATCHGPHAVFSRGGASCLIFWLSAVPRSSGRICIRRRRPWSAPDPPRPHEPSHSR